ncbi:MAG: hypothetical protein AAGA71_09945 [Pseudomonadota bacterium]
MRRLIALALAGVVISATFPAIATACSPRLNIFAARPSPDGGHHYVIGRLTDMRVAKRIGTDAQGKRLSGPFVRFHAVQFDEVFEGRLVGHRIGPDGAEPVDRPFRAVGQDEFSRHASFMGRTEGDRLFEVEATPDAYVARFGMCGNGTVISDDPALIQMVGRCMTGGPCEGQNGW